MLDLRLYMLQRVTAIVMGPLVIGHIILIVYAIRGGISAEEILSRTQGSLWWGLYYGTFVLAVSVHAAIGLRVITSEMLGLRGVGLSVLTWGSFAVLLVMGARAVYAVTAA
ncbi:succinate dehydrogenase [Citreimonas salinaria]|uniref:Fumarate reductase subunit C n=1 Tax=Citreimonas salinaria TaxID=321339 RepID=A0A1H3NH09_9RHOB|nr:succinate dehydrogenase [Citreimonas salinaria]SDY88187.1 fumarate reductase subunit C [Citreimonas salinaria]